MYACFQLIPPAWAKRPRAPAIRLSGVPPLSTYVDPYAVKIPRDTSDSSPIMDLEKSPAVLEEDSKVTLTIRLIMQGKVSTGTSTAPGFTEP